MKSAAAGLLESDSQVQFCIDLALAFFHLFRGSFKICLMLYCFGKQIWGKSGMVLCFAFFDQSIPLNLNKIRSNRYNRASSKLAKAHLESRHRKTTGSDFKDSPNKVV